MKVIAKQPYVKVERQIKSVELIRIEHRRTIYLYDNRIVTEHREFPIKDVLDISYRFIGDGGLLYLHTSRGVYSYNVKSSPEDFVQACKKHIASYPHS
ncbi:hypothetical protein [Oceanobacillus sp. Castelsardo]|uniref:hypothetical protein n=1 Tax=Oceanobacillus sp. Castelsardo TaxID=1851204 RepID=UPI000838D227|nr:hypothetical protein [Oceanobacillus sp. Castelsardo]